MINIDHSADVSKKAEIGEGTKIWHQVQIREGARIGKDCVIGKGVYVDKDVAIGSRVRIQNYASLYNYCNIEDDVFIGPYVCLTNDLRPRVKENWSAGKIIIKKGASLGAGTIVLPNISIGEYAMIGAGSVVTKDVPSHTLVLGTPAKFRAFVCKCGRVVSRAQRKPKNLACEDCRDV